MFPFKLKTAQQLRKVKMKKRILFALVILLSVLSVQAAPTPAKLAPSEITIAPDTYSYMTDEQYEAEKKAVKNVKRSVAKIDNIDENVALSPEFRQIRDVMIGGKNHTLEKSALTLSIKPQAQGIQTADDLAKLIDDLDNDDYFSVRTASGAIQKTAKTLPEDAQFLAALLVGMKPFRAITVRAKPLIEDYKFLHAMVLTSLRMTSSGINVFLPTPQWQAGFKYITEPYAGLTEKNFIPSDEHFRAFIAKEVIPVNQRTIARLAALDFKKPIFFDNKIAYATANFVADGDRFIQLGEAERRTVLSSAFLTQSALYSTISYSWKGLFGALQNTMTRVYGFEQVFDVEGATAKRRTEIIRQQRSTLFRKEDRVAKEYMPSAYKSLREGLRQTELAWEQIQKDSSGSVAASNLFDPQAFMPFARLMNTGVDNLKRAVGGQPIVSAVVQGEVIRFDMAKFFGGETSPESLLDFLPVRFEEGCKKFVPSGRCVSPAAKASKIEYRNYSEGSPIGWKLDTYQKYFPDMKNQKDVQTAARILSQSWGGWIIGIPLAGMVL